MSKNPKILWKLMKVAKKSLHKKSLHTSERIEEFQWNLQQRCDLR